MANFLSLVFLIQIFTLKEKEFVNVQQPVSLPLHISGMSNFIGGPNDKKVKKSATVPTTSKQSPTNKSKTKTHEPNTEQLAQPQKRHSKNNQSKNAEHHKSNASSNLTREDQTHSAHQNSPSTHIQQQTSNTQLVPLHIPFFKWEINVDTLVRLFIFA